MNNEMNQENHGYEYQPREIEPMNHRSFVVGEGKISGVLSCWLGVLSFLSVLCYRYPRYLTTLELRGVYDPELLQHILRYGMYFALIFGLITFIASKKRMLGGIGILFTIAACALGGYSIPPGPVEPFLYPLGLDWLILSLFFSSILFIAIEKVFPKYKDQVILRPEWDLDLFYFCFNHLLVAILLLGGNYFVTTFFDWAVHYGFQEWVQSLPIIVQVILLMVCADFVLYWTHRIFHEVPLLWRFHAVHHSSEYMDWLAGSRNHFVQVFVDRSVAMVPLYLLAPDKAALDMYVIFAGIQAVYVHSNVGIPVGPLKYILATPQYHHWHHSSQRPAIDTNYAVHMPLFDKIFGTYHMPGEHWPAYYGTVKRLPRTYFKQLLYPFKSVLKIRRRIKEMRKR